MSGVSTQVLVRRQSSLLYGFIISAAMLLALLASSPVSTSAATVRTTRTVTTRTATNSTHAASPSTVHSNAAKPAQVSSNSTIKSSSVKSSKPAYVGGPDHFVNFNQNDTVHGRYQYGDRIASAGCGPTSIAMVVSTLTVRNVTPAEMGEKLSPKYFIPGSGTTTDAFPYIGQKYDHINASHAAGFGDARRALRSGGLAIVHAKPGHFTGAGHYMVLRYVGKDDRFTIADPNNAPGRDSETKTWTADQLKANGIDDIWTFTRK